MIEVSGGRGYVRSAGFRMLALTASKMNRVLLAESETTVALARECGLPASDPNRGQQITIDSPLNQGQRNVMLKVIKAFRA